MHIQLAAADYAILSAYVALVIALGFYFKRHVHGSADFLLSGRSIPAWAAGLAFLSANLGAQEVIGMAASGAKYGLMTSHFYWIGAIPAMVFLGVFMMPFYYGSKARSVPEYLKLRFDEKTRAFNAIAFAIMTVFSSGISMHAFATLMKLLLGWDYEACVALCAGIVLVYILLGGLTSTIYNEVLQFFLIVAGFTPLVILALRRVGGWSLLQQKLAPVAIAQGYAPGTWTHLWNQLATPTDNPMGVEWIGLSMGLGFVLSFGYWCTDFLVVQRAMAARSMSAARLTPLIAAIPKIFFPALVILPGMIAIAMNASGDIALPLSIDGSPDYNLTIPTLLAKFLPTGLLGIGLTALLASFMSGMAGNVTAFNTVWTWDLYQSYLAPNRSDAHYLWMGRMATVFGVAVSVAAAYAASAFNNIMDLLQLVFGFVNAPLLATFLLGMFWKRTTGHAAFFGLLGGTLAAALFHGLSLSSGGHPGIKGAWIAPRFLFRSEMGQNFYMAIIAWGVCFLLTMFISVLTRRQKSDAELVGLVYSLTPRLTVGRAHWYRRPAVVGGLVLAASLGLNLLFW
jgi:solute:Na+ symporter, SSS family